MSYLFTTSEHISNLHQHFLSLFVTCPLLPFTMSNATKVVVSTLQGINHQLQIQSQQLSSLTVVIINLSADLSSPHDVDNDDNVESTGNTHNSLLAYLNASKCLDFYVEQRWNRYSVGPHPFSILLLPWLILQNTPLNQGAIQQKLWQKQMRLPLQHWKKRKKKTQECYRDQQWQQWWSQ